MDRHWLIWDGECGMCSSSAEYIRRRDPRHQFQIVSYQNCPRPPMDDELFEGCKSALYIVTSAGQRLRGADAVLFALRTTGAKWVIPFQYPPLIWPTRLVYALVARNRGLISKMFFGGVACGLENRYPEVE